MSSAVGPGRSRLRRVQWLLLALAALAIVGGTVAQLSTVAPRQTGTNQVAPREFVVKVPAFAGMCQSPETLYARTQTLRMTLATFGRRTRPLELTVRKDGRTLARGQIDAGWSEGVVDFPITPTPKRTVVGTKICVRSVGKSNLAFGSEFVPEDQGIVSLGRRIGGKVSLVSYDRPQSLLRYMDSVAAHYGHGTARKSGGWMLWVVLGLLVAALAVAGAALLRPRARYVVAATVAVAAAWGLLTPAFHVPDETAHFAYVQGMVETGELPQLLPGRGEGSPKQKAVLLEGLRFYDVIGDTTSKPPFTAAEEAVLRAAEDRPLSRKSFDASTASANPPLYYLAQAPFYAVFRGGSILTELLVMRMVSALLCGLTALFIFLFLRELLPRHPVAAAAGALVCGFQPVFGFIGSGVNADSGLFAACAALFWASAVVLRRGLTVRRGAVLGATLAVGLLIKPLFVGLIPAGLAALALGALRLEAPWIERARRLAVGLAVAVVPVLLYAVIGSAFFDHGFLPDAAAGVAGSAVTVSTVPVGLRGEASYIWQLFLPRLGFMTSFFPDSPIRDTWFNGLVGRFGWVDYGFPRAATDTALTIVWFILGFAAVGLVRGRRAVREHWLLLLVLVLALVGVLGAIGTQQYRAAATGASQFTQPRYLLPLLSLYGAIGAIAVTALGRRAAPLLAVPLVALAFYHDVAAMILTISRYYA